MRMMPIVMPRVLPVAAAFTAALLVASCALKTPPDAAAIKAESMAAIKVPEQWKGVTSAAAADNWLTTFHDDQLTAAVSEAIANNPDLQVGAARLEQAMLYAKLAGARLYPSVDLLAKGGGGLGSDSSGIQGALLTGSWELDLWGRVRYGRAAAREDARSAQADFEYARQSMAATGAKSWFIATEAGLQAEVARASIRERGQLVSLAGTRARGGVGSDEDVSVARANVGTYRDTLRDLQFSRDQAIRGL